MELVRRDEQLHVTRRSLLRLADFRRVVLGQFISQSADAAMLLLLAKQLLFTGADGPTPVLLAQAVLSSAAPLVLVGPIAGLVADKWARKQVLVSGQAIRSVLALATIAVVVFHLHLALIAVFVLSLCASRLLYTARIASVRHLVRQHELVAADSLMSIVGVIAGLIGGMVFASLVRLSAVLVLVAVAIGHFAAAYAYDQTRSWLGGEGETSTLRWRAVLAQLSCGKTRYAVLATSTHRCLVGVTVACVSMNLDGRTGGSASGYAATVGVAGLAGFIGSLTSEWANEHLRRRALTIGVFAASGLVLVPVQFVNSPMLCLAIIGLIAFCFQNLRVASDATIQANAAPGSCGRVFAAYDVAFNLTYVGGLLVGLSLSSNISSEVGLMACAPLFFVGAIVFAVIERDVRIGDTQDAAALVVESRESTPVAV